MTGRVALRKTSLVDYPGRIAAVLFFPGCDLRCPWCHNGALVAPSGGFPESEELVSLDDVVAFLTRRSSVLGGVVLSGGEPLIQPEIESVIERIKNVGLPVKIDTNGTRPETLSTILAHEETKPDYVAMDLKLAPTRYRSLVGKEAADAIRLSAETLERSDVAHEFRSIALPSDFFADDDIRALAPLAGNAPWYFAPFVPGTCLDARWNDFPPTSKTDAEKCAKLARECGANGLTRGG